MVRTPRRAVNRPGNDVGKRRQLLYRQAHERIEEALAAGFILEAITICESLLTDRLESRLAYLHGQAENKRAFSTIGKLTTELLGARLGEAPEARTVYEEVAAWGRDRNEALHQMVKLDEDSSESWTDKYHRAQSTAVRGVAIAKRLKRLVQGLNRTC